MSEYQAKQIAFVLDNTQESEFPFAKLKVQSDTYATKWMDVTEQQLVAIRDLLAKEDEPTPWIIAEFTGDALNELEHSLGNLVRGEHIYKITFGIDGGAFKVKVNEGMWTPPLTTVEERP